MSERPKCRRCGKTLAKNWNTRSVRRELPNDAGFETVEERIDVSGYGYGNTGLFCSLTCGHWYAVDVIRGSR